MVDKSSSVSSSSFLITTRPVKVKKPCPKCGRLVHGLKSHIASKHPSDQAKSAKLQTKVLADGLQSAILNKLRNLKNLTSSTTASTITHVTPAVANTLAITDSLSSLSIKSNSPSSTTTPSIISDSTKPIKAEANEHLAPYVFRNCVTCKSSCGQAWISHWIAAHPNKYLPQNSSLKTTSVKCPNCDKVVSLLGLSAHWRSKQHRKAANGIPTSTSTSATTTSQSVSYASPHAASNSIATSNTAVSYTTPSTVSNTASNIAATSNTVSQTACSTTETISESSLSAPLVLPPPSNRAAEAFTRRINGQLATYKTDSAYTGPLSLVSAQQSAASLTEIVTECVAPPALSIYRSKVHGEVMRLVDRCYTEELWDGCRECIQELLTSSLLVPHNSTNQKTMLQTQITKCNSTVFEQKDKNVTGSKQRNMTEIALKFWGTHSFDVFPDNKYDVLSNEIMVMVNKRMPNAESRARQAEAMKEISNVIHKIHPTAYVEIFGSAATGLDCVGSDLDCGVVGLGTDEKRVLSFLKDLGKILRGRRDYVKVTPILHARIPIIKCKDAQLGVEMDISQMRDEQRLKTQLLLKYRSLDERFVILTHVVKKFAQVNGLGDASAGGLNSFGWTLLVLQFCQMTSPPVLPNVQDLTKDWDGWVSTNSENVGSLLAQFFIFYTRKFHPLRDCVSIRAGGFSCALSRRTGRAATSSLLPGVKTLASGNQGLQQKEVLASFQRTQQTLLCVEDPLDPTDNVGRGLVRRKVEDIYTAMCEARELLRFQPSLAPLLRPLPSADDRWDNLVDSSPPKTASQDAVVKTLK